MPILMTNPFPPELCWPRSPAPGRAWSSSPRPAARKGRSSPAPCRPRTPGRSNRSATPRSTPPPRSSGSRPAACSAPRPPSPRASHRAPTAIRACSGSARGSPVPLTPPARTASPIDRSRRRSTTCVALIQERRPDAVIGYDDEGTYGHPDHVRAHHVTAAACARTGTPMIEVSSAPDPAADAGFTWRDHPGVADVVRRAVGLVPHSAHGRGLGRRGAQRRRDRECRRDQEQADQQGRDQEHEAAGEKTGISIRHVGGQDDVVLLRTGLHWGGGAAAGVNSACGSECSQRVMSSSVGR